MPTYACYARNFLILNFYISFVTGNTTITTACYGLVSSSLTISCEVNPQITSVTITSPGGSNAAFCSAPLPGLATVCNPTGSYTTVPTTVGNVTTFVLTIPSLDISTHDGNWTCNHLTENSTGKVCVNAPLFPPGKEPTFTATSIPSNTISCSGEVYCQHPVSALTFELLYAEENKAYTVLTQQPSASKQNLGSNGCGSEESNVTFSETVSCVNFKDSLAGKTFTLMARFNQSNLPPGMNTYNVTSSGSFSCPDVETTTAATTNGSDNGSGLSEGAIAGIVIVVIACGVVVCVIFIVIFKKKKNKGPILPCLKRLDDKDKEKLHNNCSEGPSDDNCSENEKGKHPWKSSVEPLNTSGDTKDITKDETRNSPTSALSKSGVDVQILPSPSDTPRRLQPIATTVSVTNNQEEKTKNKKKKKKKKQAKQEQNQQQQEGKDNTGFDNGQRENIPSDDTSNPETKTTPSNNDKIPSDDTSNPETKTTPSNNNNLHSDDLGDPETITPNNNDKIPSDDPANMETKTTPSNNDNLHSDDLGDPETATPSNNDKIPSDDPGNKETTTPSNNHNIPSDDSGNPETTTPSNIDT